MPAYKDADDRWRYRFQFRGQRIGGSTPKNSNTKRAAELLERRHHDRLIGGASVELAPRVRDFAERFLEHQAARTKPLTQLNQRATIRNHVVAHIGGLRIDEITAEVIDRLATTWSKTLAAKTINVRLGHLRRMLSQAREWGLIVAVPRVRFLRVTKDHPRFLSEDEARRLIEAAPVFWRAMIFTALRTGLRVGELRGLTWGDVDFERGWLHVRRTDPGKPNLPATAPKGGGARSVPLTPDAIKMLRTVRPADARPATIIWRGKEPGRTRSEKGCCHGIEQARDAAGLGADIGWHTLRHTYASWLVMRGVPLRVVQQYLGHASIVHTERYAHLAPDFGHAAVALLDLPLAHVAPPALPPGKDEP
jgi:integrase